MCERNSAGVVLDPGESWKGTGEQWRVSIGRNLESSLKYFRGPIEYFGRQEKGRILRVNKKPRLKDLTLFVNEYKTRWIEEKRVESKQP